MNVKDGIAARQEVIPNRPQIGDESLSFKWTNAVSDTIERIARFDGGGFDYADLHYCKLSAGALKPSGAAETAPQTVIADVFGKKQDGSLVDTEHDITITNRTNGYFYQNSFVWATRHPQSGEWHIIWPTGHTIYGQFDSDCTELNKVTFSVYYLVSGSPATWTDTTDNIATTDPSPVFNITGTTINAGKRATASLDTRSLLFLAGPLKCN